MSTSVVAGAELLSAHRVAAAADAQGLPGAGGRRDQLLQLADGARPEDPRPPSSRSAASGCRSPRSRRGAGRPARGRGSRMAETMVASMPAMIGPGPVRSPEGGLKEGVKS